MKYSVVIPSRNRNQLVRRAVRSALATSPDAEVVVVDDCSASRLEADALGAPVTLLRNDSNLGPGKSRERGLAAARGDIAVMLDDDDELLPGWQDTIDAALREFPQWRRYPVLHFGSTASYLQSAFMLVDAESLIDPALRRGAFVAVVNLERRAAIDHPANRIGGEGLLWARIGREHGIPTWGASILRVNSDAPNRLTSFRSQVLNAAEHAVHQRDLIESMPPEYWRTWPDKYRKRVLGELIYTLIARLKPAAELRREALALLGWKGRAVLLLGRSPRLLVGAFYLYRMLS